MSAILFVIFLSFNEFSCLVFKVGMFLYKKDRIFNNFIVSKDSIVFNIQVMEEASSKNDILVYPQDYKQQIKGYIKRKSINAFKQIDAEQITKEFSILNKSQGSKQHIYRGSVYKHNRVNIESVENFYLNASWMRSVLDGQVWALFASAPDQKLIENFWLAIYHYNIKKIFMICQLGGVVRYWPNPAAELKLRQAKLEIHCVSENKIGPAYVRTTMELRGSEGNKLVEHVHWKGWSDMGTPQGQESEEMFKKLAQQCLEMVQKKELFLIHCMAGIGRTGTLGTMIEALRCAKSTGQVSIFQVLDNIRRNRVDCVQTLKQYSFIYNMLQKSL